MASLRKCVCLSPGSGTWYHTILRRHNHTYLFIFPRGPLIEISILCLPEHTSGFGCFPPGFLQKKKKKRQIFFYTILSARFITSLILSAKYKKQAHFADGVI